MSDPQAREKVECHSWVPADPAFPNQRRAEDDPSKMICPEEVVETIEYPEWTRKIVGEGSPRYGHLCAKHRRNLL